MTSLFVDGDQCSCGLALDGPTQAYNEKAFQYFLALERKRSEYSDRPFLLLLVELKKQPGTGERLEPRVTGKLFASLWQALRETDVIGWYREQQVAGAVLTFADGPDADASSRIADRVGRTLTDSLSPDIVRRLQVRVYQLPARPTR